MAIFSCSSQYWRHTLRCTEFYTGSGVCGVSPHSGTVTNPRCLGRLAVKTAIILAAQWPSRDMRPIPRDLHSLDCVCVSDRVSEGSMFTNTGSFEQYIRETFMNTLFIVSQTHTRSLKNTFSPNETMFSHWKVPQWRVGIGAPKTTRSALWGPRGDFALFFSIVEWHVKYFLLTYLCIRMTELCETYTENCDVKFVSCVQWSADSVNKRHELLQRRIFATDRVLERSSCSSEGPNGMVEIGAININNCVNLSSLSAAAASSSVQMFSSIETRIWQTRPNSYNCPVTSRRLVARVVKCTFAPNRRRLDPHATKFRSNRESRNGKDVEMNGLIEYDKKTSQKTEMM